MSSTSTKAEVRASEKLTDLQTTLEEAPPDTYRMQFLVKIKRALLLQIKYI